MEAEHLRVEEAAGGRGTRQLRGPTYQYRPTDVLCKNVTFMFCERRLYIFYRRQRNRAECSDLGDTISFYSEIKNYLNVTVFERDNYLILSLMH